jgi:hypothetical protein
LGKEKELRRSMLLLALLAAMMLLASPVLAHQGGPHHGDKYWKNYYPNTYYKWKTPDGQWHKTGYWYYCQYHKYNDPNSTHPYFKAWVGYKPTGKHYWESFYWHS